MSLGKALGFGLCSGVLVLVAFYVPYAWPLIFVALIPLLHGVYGARSRYGAFGAGLLAGMVIVGGTTWWMFSTTTLPGSIGLSPLTNGIAVIVSWLLIMLFTAPFVGVWALLARSLEVPKMFDAIAVSLLWVMAEYARMYGFNIVTYAANVTNPPFWSTGFVGYVLADSESWLQLASLGGVALMSLMVIGTNILLYTFMRQWTLSRARLTVIASIVLVSLLPLGSIRASLDALPVHEISVGLVSLYSSATESEEHSTVSATDQKTHIAELVEEGATLIVLPEGSRFHTASSSVQETITFEGPVIVDSGASSTFQNTNSFWAYATDQSGTELVPLRTKMVLTPQGEYLIEIFYQFLFLIGKGDIAERFEQRYLLTNGDIGHPLILKDIRASVLFCFEIFAPEIGRTLVTEQETDLILTMVSHVRFTHSLLLEKDTFRFVRVRAVEARVPLVMSAKQTPAYAFDQYGRVLATIGHTRVSEHAVVRVRVPDTQYDSFPHEPQKNRE